MKAPDPYLIDDDSPEWTAEDFKNARPAREVLTELFGKEETEEFLKRHRGPQKEPTKQKVGIRLDADLLETLRNSGPGWQPRVNQALREHFMAN